MEGRRAAVGFEAEQFKVHQWELRDTEQIPGDGRVWSLARVAAAGAEIGTGWKSCYEEVLGKQY